VGQRPRGYLRRAGPFTTTGDHDEPIMATDNSNTCWSIAEGERGRGGNHPQCPALTQGQTEACRTVRPFTKTGDALEVIPDHGYGRLITFAFPDGVRLLEHDHKLFPRPLNAIIDSGNDDPDLVGVWGAVRQRIGAGFSRGGRTGPIYSAPDFGNI
jgi:hypothetical protein